MHIGYSPYQSVSLLATVCGLFLVAGCHNASKLPTFSAGEKPIPSSQTEVAANVPANDFEHVFDRARLLEKVGKYDEARKLYERLILSKPLRYEPYHRLAVVADHQHRYREAETLYRQAVGLQPENSDLLNDLGYFLFRRQKWEASETVLKKSLAQTPSNPRTHNNLGMVYAQQGRKANALEEFRHAGNEADAQYNLAFALTLQDNIEAARVHLQRALIADPGYILAQRALQMFEHRSGSQPDNSARLAAYIEGLESSPGKTQHISHTTPAFP